MCVSSCCVQLHGQKIIRRVKKQRKSPFVCNNYIVKLRGRVFTEDSSSLIFTEDSSSLIFTEDSSSLIFTEDTSSLIFTEDSSSLIFTRFCS